MFDVGVICCIGVVLNYYVIGWMVNGMMVWDVVDEWIDEFGVVVGVLLFVIYCYC